MIKIAHETTMATFKMVQALTDYDYFLVHMLHYDHNPKYNTYSNAFADSVISGRETILDNSIFELGHAFDHDFFVRMINCYEPTYYVVPDVLNDATATKKSYDNFMNRYGKKISSRSKPIAVIHGKTSEELLNSFINVAKKGVSKIAIPYDSLAFSSTRDLRDFAINRPLFVNKALHACNLLGLDVPKIHLLGASNPGVEAMQLNILELTNLIDSMDTSAPVMLAYNNKHIIETLNDYNYVKPKTLMANMFNEPLPDIKTRSLIATNILEFRTILSGTW